MEVSHHKIRGVVYKTCLILGQFLSLFKNSMQDYHIYVEPSAFLTLLKFLYSDDVIIGPESVMTTLYTVRILFTVKVISIIIGYYCFRKRKLNFLLNFKYGLNFSIRLFLYISFLNMINCRSSYNFSCLIYRFRPRCAVAGKELVVSRFQRIEGRWGYSGTPDRIKLVFLPFFFFLLINYYFIIVLLSTVSMTIYAIFFLNSGLFCSFCNTYIQGPDSHYGTKGLRRIVHQSAAGGVVTFQFTYAAGNNNGTSVEDGQIPEIVFYTKLS
uniref:PHR domain-containing protein n=1 Tax=Heterorhabditis bacteriophora TaxID=37862 RepID=A0A1I7WAY9_HETBA